MATIATSGSAKYYAGENADATITADTNAINEFIENGEAFLSGLTRYNIVSNWATLSGSAAAGMLKEYVARLAAIDIIKYNMAGYTSRIEAEDLININWARIIEIEKVLEKANIQDFIGV